MDGLIAIAGFIGGWLLVAGPIYQAALELKDENIERDHLSDFRTKKAAPKHSSAWWWLLPPVKLFLEHRNSEQYRQEFFKSLPSEDVEAFISFFNKATGWLFVAAGGIMIATKETYEMIEHFELGIEWFWVLVLVSSFLSFANTAVRTSRTEQILHGNKER